MILNCDVIAMQVVMAYCLGSNDQSKVCTILFLEYFCSVITKGQLHLKSINLKKNFSSSWSYQNAGVGDNMSKNGHEAHFLYFPDWAIPEALCPLPLALRHLSPLCLGGQRYWDHYPALPFTSQEAECLAESWVEPPWE